jgi:GNAT superfamily N-acetyltransferase
VEISTLRPRQSKEAAAVAAAAFADDPIWQHAVAHPRRRRYPHTILLRASLRWTRSEQMARVARSDGRIIGLASWSLDGTIKLHESPEAVDPRHLRAWRTLFRRLGRDRFQVSAMFTALTESNPYDEGWFLGTLVVLPEHQGSGVGSALLRDGLAEADRHGQPVTLQTSTPENVRFYERHGFEVTEMLDELFPGAPPLWTLRRPVSAVDHQA